MGKKTILIDLSLLALLILMYFIFKRGCDGWIISACLAVCLWSFISVVISIPQYKVRPVLFFLLSFWIVNCQLYLDLLAGMIPADFYAFSNEALINQGALLTAIAFMSFSVGYKLTSYYSTDQKELIPYHPTANVFLIIFQIICFVWWLTSLTPEDFTGSNYSESGAFDKVNTIAGYAEIFFITAQILCLSYYMKKPDNCNSFITFITRISGLVLITSLSYVVIRLFSGDRGGAIYTVTLYLFAYLFKVRKQIRLLPFVGVLIIGAVVMTSIGLTRTRNYDLSLSEKLTYAVENQDMIEAPSISPYTQELANSAHCTHIALEQIELVGQPYTKGLFHLCYVLKFIPFVGNYVVNEILHVPRILQSSSEFVTITFNGPYYTWGLGTTTIADNYLEFGLIGVIIGLFIIGFCFKKVDTCLLFSTRERAPMGMIILVLVMCYGSFYIPRSVFFMMLRNWFYAIVVYLFVKLLTTRKI